MKVVYKGPRTSYNKLLVDTIVVRKQLIMIDRCFLYKKLEIFEPCASFGI